MHRYARRSGRQRRFRTRRSGRRWWRRRPARARGKVKEMLAKVDPDLARTADRMRPLGAGRWELKAVIDDDCRSRVGATQGAAVPRRPADDVGATPGAGGTGSAGPPRPFAAATRAAPPPDSRRCRSNFGAENAGRAGRRGGAAERHAGQAPADFGAERVGGRRPPPRYGCEAARQWLSRPRPSRRRLRRRRRPWRRRGPSSRQERRLRRRGFPEPRTDLRQPPESPCSAPKAGGGSQPAAHRSGRLVTPATAPPQPRVRGRAIPAAVRRQVWERDGGCCSYVDQRSVGAGAAPGICWRSITWYRMRLAAAPSPTISGCCAPPITATATAMRGYGGRRR